MFGSEQAGDTPVLYPDAPLPVGHVEHDPEKLRSAYDEGRRIALRELDKIKEFTL